MNLRRVQRGGVPVDYHECGGGAGYLRFWQLPYLKIAYRAARL